MSDVMLHAVLQMPFEMAMATELSRRQFYDRVQKMLVEHDVLLARIESAPFATAKTDPRGMAVMYGPPELIGKCVRLVVEG